MSDNAEEGIFRAQAAAAKDSGLQDRQKKGIAGLDERIYVFILAIGFIALAIVWAMTTSPWLLYGSLAGVILVVVIWGMVHIKRIQRIRQERDREANAWQSENSK
jgi:Flp pilus assembly protein TadB